MTVEQWLDHWLTTIAARRVRPRTLESHSSAMRNHVYPLVGNIPVSALRAEDVELLLADMDRRGLASATQLRVLHVVSRGLKIATQRGHAAHNVATLVDPPILKQSRVTVPLTREEARAVLAAAAGKPNAARWTVALTLGLRQSEVLGLQWADFDANARTLRIRRGLHRVEGRGLVFEEPKTDRSRRTLVVPAPLVSQLQAHRDAQCHHRASVGRAWPDNDLMFVQPNGRPIDRRSDHRAWTRLLQSAGVAHRRLHDARHFVASSLLADAVPARVVSELLGHSATAITLDTYSHLLPGVAEQAADRMSAVLFG